MPAKPKSLIARLPEPEVVDSVQILRDYISGKTDLVCVLGPTASGKTRYAVELARDINAIAQLGLLEGCPSRMTEYLCSIEGAEIISADSRQVFRGMDIGTGKDLDEYGEIPPERLYKPYFGPQCKNCGGRLTCNGCAKCARCMVLDPKT